MTAPDPATEPHRFLEHLYHTAVRRALPLHNTAAFLPPPPRGRTVVLGAGKAGGSMAHAVEALWPADAPLQGLVVTRYHHVPPAPRRGDAAHRDRRGRRTRCPTPRACAPRSASLAMAHGLTDGRPGAVPDFRRRLGPAHAAGRRPDAGRQAGAINRALLEVAVPTIDEMNCVRKHLSRDQGRPAGRDLRAGPRRDAGHQRRARRRPVDHRQRPDGARRHELRRRGGHPAALRHRGAGRGHEPAGAGCAGNAQAGRHGCSPGHEVHLIATPRQSLEAAAEAARAAGLEAHILSDEIEGESREVGKVHAALARAVATARPAVSRALRDPLGRRNHGDGEKRRRTGAPRGRGGRAGEFCLGLAQALQGQPACGRWRRIPMASTAWKTTRVRWWRRKRFRGRSGAGHEGATSTWTATTPTATSASSTTW